VRFLGEDFLRMWSGRAAVLSARFLGFELHALDGRGNEVLFEEVVLSAVDCAWGWIYVE
jgi:hypothetical protein